MLELYPLKRKLIKPVLFDRTRLARLFGVRNKLFMDKIFRLTSSEYAKLIGITNEALRSRRRRNLEDGNFTKVGKEYFWKTPVRGRPDIELAAPNNRSVSSMIPGPISLKRKRRRGVMKKGESTNYHNAPNGWQLEQLNRIRALGKLREELSDEVVDELAPEMFEQAKKNLAAKKEKEFKKELAKAERPPGERIVGIDYTPKKYGTMLNARGLKSIEDKKHQSLLRKDHQKHGVKYINKFDMEGRLYRSNQLDFSDSGSGGTRFGSNNNSYYDIAPPTNDGSVSFNERDLPPDDRDPIFKNKIQESIYRLKKNK